jgi:hypothetical protein
MAEFAQEALFDLAINRAARVTALLGMTHLEIWHSKTRFAARVQLPAIQHALKIRPVGEWYWIGGESGTWQVGKPVTP